MRIGVPKEIKNHEYRIGLTPGECPGSSPSWSRGYRLKPPAAHVIGLEDEHYRQAGANHCEIGRRSVGDSRYGRKSERATDPASTPMIRKDQVLFTYLHLAPDPKQPKALIGLRVGRNSVRNRH